MQLDADTCYRALTARDRRFDGRFFVGVATTGVYCRPVCPARTPRRDRCSFYASPALAEKAGFRACLRCRPELSPGTAPTDAVPALVRQALARIDEGALIDHSLADLAAELGVTDRHLRRAFTDELGVSPVELAQTRRLALAKQLLHETSLTITEVALASGFGSLRRFHALFAARFGRPPAQLRKGTAAPERHRLHLRLDYRPPLAWPALLQRLRAEALPGLERVTATTYTRLLHLDRTVGTVTVEHSNHSLLAEVSTALAPALMHVVARLRVLFDLDAHPDVVDAHLARDPMFAAQVRALPGVRAPGCIDPLETTIRILAGRPVATRLLHEFGDPVTIDGEPWRRFPTDLHRLPLSSWIELGLPRPRAATVHAVLAAIADGTLALRRGADIDLVLARLAALGVDRRRAHTIAARSLAAPDAFPAAARPDDAWRPWRAYAAAHLALLKTSQGAPA